MSRGFPSLQAATENCHYKIFRRRFSLILHELDGVAQLITNPPPTSFITLSKKKKKKKKEKKRKKYI